MYQQGNKLIFNSSEKMKWDKLYNKILSTNILTKAKLIYNFSLILAFVAFKNFSGRRCCCICFFY